MANTGILIFAHNCNSSKRDYLYSASICAKTIKQQNPDIPISLLTRNSFATISSLAALVLPLTNLQSDPYKLIIFYILPSELPDYLFYLYQLD